MEPRVHRKYDLCPAFRVPWLDSGAQPGFSSGFKYAAERSMANVGHLNMRDMLSEIHPERKGPHAARVMSQGSGKALVSWKAVRRLRADDGGELPLNLRRLQGPPADCRHEPFFQL